MRRPTAVPARWISYPDGSPGLEYAGEVYSVNLSGYGMLPWPGHVFIPGYGEHADKRRILFVAGVIDLEPAALVRFGPFDAHAYLCRVSEAVPGRA